MASPNISEMATVAIASRTKMLADNMSDNVPLFYRLKQGGKIETVSGGEEIYQELEYAENSSFVYISGYEPINVQPSDVFSAAVYDWKEAAVTVSISKLEEGQNSGKERMIPLLKKRIMNAEKTMRNALTKGVYSDGTGSGGKQITGLEAQVAETPTTGTVGGIDRASFDFWQNAVVSGTTANNILDKMRQLWILTCRNNDKVDLISFGNTFYQWFWDSLQEQQRFQSGNLAKAGFDNLKFVSADVVLGGGVGGSQEASQGYFLNTDYIQWRPHVDFNMVPTEDRISQNQMAMVKPIYFMGNLTMSNASLQGHLAN